MDTPTIRLKDPDGWLTIEALTPEAHEVYAARARFGRESLGGAWRLDLFDPPGFADEVEKLHRSLEGQAILSSDGFSLTLTADRTGHISASVHIDGPWSFGVEGWIEFTVAIDQTYLPDLWRDVRATFPQVPDAQRRVGETLQ